MYRIPLSFIMLTTTATAFGAETDGRLSWNTIEIGGLVSRHNLEGPAATGYSDIEGADTTGGGVYVRGRMGLGDWFHITADASMEQVDGDVTVARATLAPGVHLNLSNHITVYAELGAAMISVSGLDDYAERTADAVGDGGSDVGLIGLVGVRGQLWDVWEWHLAAGYLAFGSESYPAGQPEAESSGDGPMFELGAAYQVTDRWALAATWTGAWVEDAGFETDLATQQLRVGLRYGY